MALSEFDRKYLTDEQQKSVIEATTAWNIAKRNGDQAGMDAAAKRAAAIRAQAGYSGGKDGAGYTALNNGGKPKVVNDLSPLAVEMANERDKMLTPSVSRQAGKTANIPELQRAAEEMALANGTFTGNRQTTKQEPFSAGKLVAGTVEKGLNEFSQGIGATGAALEKILYSPLDLVTGEKFGTAAQEHGIFTKARENDAQTGERLQQKYAANVAAGGKAAELVDKYGTMTVATIPDALLAIASGGGSAAPEIGKTVQSAAYKIAASYGKNPQFWTSLARVFGTSYEQAKADGASEADAYAYAVGNGMFNAAIEVGGGIQTLPSELQNESVWRAIGKTMVEEAGEEVTQGIVERGAQNIVYGKNNPLFSVTDENAVLNPRTAAEEAIGGAVVGGLLGGGQTVAVNAINALASRVNAQSETDAAADRAIEMLTGQQRESTPTAAQNAQESAQSVSRETMAPARETPQSGAQAQTFARFYEQDVRDMTGELGGKAFVERYDGAQDIAEYTAGFLRYWNAGATGKKIGSVQNTGGLNELQRYAAYYAGQNDAARSTVSEQSGVRDVAINAQRGLSSDDTTARNTAAWSDELRGTVDALGRKLGVRVVVDDTFEGVSANGYYDAKTNEIHLARDAENPVLQVVRHEATHRMQQLSPKEYRAFRDYAVRMAGEDAVEMKRQAYSRGDVLLSEEEAMDEIAAETAEKLLTDETAISDFIRENRTAAQKFYDALRSVVQKVKEALGGDQTLAQAERLWKSAFEKADAQAQENAKTQNAAQTDGGKKWSTKQDALEVDGVDWMDNNSSIKDQLAKHADEINKMQPVAVVEYVHNVKENIVDIMMDSLSRLGGANMKNGGVGFVFDVEGAKSINAHAKTPELRAASVSAPYVAKYGKLIAGQKNHENTGLTTLTFAAPVVINGTPVNVGLAIQFQLNGRPRAVNVEMQDGSKFTINKNEAFPGSSSRVDRYSQGTSLDTRNTSANSITDAAENSKRKFSLKTDSEGRELSEQQQEYFKDSKVRDEDGRQ